MYYFETQTKNDPFKTAIITSLVLHVSIVLAFFIQSIFFTSENLIYDSAVRVDLVALPDKMKPDEKIDPLPAEKPVLPKKEMEQAKKTEKTDDSINLDPAKKKQLTALAKIKERQALDKIKKQMEAEERLKNSKKLFKGNQISTGSDLSGLSKIEHDNYIAQVKQKIYQNWSLPEWLGRKNFKAQVLVRYDRSGALIDKKIVRPSGNQDYDQAILDAIEKSAPVPAPPEKLSTIVANEGVLVGFPE